jgi:carboxyl-terminal processing protease
MTADRSDAKDTVPATNGGAGTASDLAGFSQCANPSELWQRFYHTEWEQVKDSYFDPPALKDFDGYEHKYDAALCQSTDLDIALQRMTASLHNPWTKYTSLAEQTAIADQARLGLLPSGLELASAGPGQYKIEFIHYGSAAQKSDLREGDIVKSINGKDLSTLSLAEAKALQAGRAGDIMQIDAEHNGVKEKVALPIAVTPGEQIEAKMLPQDIGYVRLPDFSGEARIDALIQELDKLNKQTPGGLKGLVLDLRNDPGGDLPNAVAVASLFLPQDKTVVAKQYVRSQGPEAIGGLKEKDLTTAAADGVTVNAKLVDKDLVAALRKLPLAVLINGSSVSAAEVLTGALKDNGRATIVGTHSFGKGVGYRDYQVPIVGKLRVAEMKYLTPSGFDLSGQGISPNVEVEAKPGGTRADSNDEQLKAALQTFNH